MLKIPQFFKRKTVPNGRKLQLLRSQFDFFWSSRLRRGIKTYNFYKNIWDEKALSEFLRSLRKNVLHRNRRLLLSAVGLLSFDWNSERITLDESVQEFFNEFERIDCLKALTVEGGKSKGVETRNRQSADYRPNDVSSWEFYVQKKNMITWRREEEEGHFAYKVYVSYPDITAEDFLFVQTDIEYRREWDDTAVVLNVVESDENDSSSQVIYWEMLWPKLFSNRDYVFVRKHFIDSQRNLILIVNKSTKHPSCPLKADLQRVKEYWSFMVIKPKTTFDKPGLEFILTYYDNPGIKIPKYVTNWVAQRQLPDFIEKLYQATLRYAEKKTSMKWGKNRDPGFEYPSDVRLDEFEGNGDDMIDNVNKMKNTGINPNLDEAGEPGVESTAVSKSWWNWLLPFNYLH